MSCSKDVLQLRMRVSKGTYVRTVAEAIGERLGCGAHLRALRRTRVGLFNLAQSIGLDQLEALSPDERVRRLERSDLMVAGLPRVDLDHAGADAICHGRAVRLAPAADGGLVRLYDSQGVFLGLGEIAGTGELIPKRLVDQANTKAALGLST